MTNKAHLDEASGAKSRRTEESDTKARFDAFAMLIVALGNDAGDDPADVAACRS